jgi:hypothetical protein
MFLTTHGTNAVLPVCAVTTLEFSVAKNTGGGDTVSNGSSWGTSVCTISITGGGGGRGTLALYADIFFSAGLSPETNKMHD